MLKQQRISWLTCLAIILFQTLVIAKEQEELDSNQLQSDSECLTLKSLLAFVQQETQKSYFESKTVEQFLDSIKEASNQSIRTIRLICPKEFWDFESEDTEEDALFITKSMEKCTERIYKIGSIGFGSDFISKRHVPLTEQAGIYLYDLKTQINKAYLNCMENLSETNPLFDFSYIYSLDHSEKFDGEQCLKSQNSFSWDVVNQQSMDQTLSQLVRTFQLYVRYFNHKVSEMNACDLRVSFPEIEFDLTDQLNIQLSLVSQLNQDTFDSIDNISDEVKFHLTHQDFVQTLVSMKNLYKFILDITLVNHSTFDQLLCSMYGQSMFETILDINNQDKNRLYLKFDSVQSVCAIPKVFRINQTDFIYLVDNFHRVFAELYQRVDDSLFHLTKYEQRVQVYLIVLRQFMQFKNQIQLLRNPRGS